MNKRKTKPSKCYLYVANNCLQNNKILCYPEDNLLATMP